MRPDDATAALAPLIAAFPGWAGDTIALYVKELGTLNSPSTLRHAIEGLIHTAHFRPTVAQIREAYNGESSRRQMAAIGPADEMLDPPVDILRGSQVARTEYSSECRRQGREPAWAFFDRLFASARANALRR